MRLERLVPTLILLIPGMTLAQGWFEYIDRSSYFSVSFPAEPVVREIAYESPLGLIFPAQVYRADDTRGGAYAVTVVDFTDAERLHAQRRETAENTSLRSWLWDVRASVAHAAWNFRRRGGEITFDGWSDVERVEGHQLQITNPDQSRTFVGIYLHEMRLYILEATAPPSAPPPGLFQQSLRFLDEEGRRVRYELEVNGNITRIQPSYEYVGDGAEVIERAAE